jgi:hypothetical protein
MDIAKKILGRLHRNVGSVLASDPEHFHGHYAGFLQSLHETVEVTGLNTAQPANNTQGRAAPSVVGLGSLIDKKNNDARQGVIQSLINTLSPGGLYGGNSHDAITCRNVVLAACVEDCKNKVKHPLASTICVWVSPGRCASPSAAASFFRCASCCHGASAWGACTPHATDQVVATTVALHKKDGSSCISSSKQFLMREPLRKSLWCWISTGRLGTSYRKQRKSNRERYEKAEDSAGMFGSRRGT